MSKPQDFYSIGRFAQLGKMTIHQLRYLDEKDVLKPNFRDASSGYRYYTYGQLEKLLCIRTLRGLDVPLETIVKIHEANDLKFLLGSLTENLARLEDKWREALREYESNALLIREVIEGLSVLERGKNTAGVVELVEVPRMTVLAARRNMEPRGTMVFADRFIELHNICEQQRLHCDVGAYAVNHCSYLTQFSGQPIDLETMLPLKHPPAQCEGVRSFGGFTGVSTVFVGPYEEMLPTYRECIRWAREQDLEITEQSVEEYILASGGVMDPSQYVTRLILPLKGSTL